ncbi:response regulator [Cohnella suwonensis]|uniref:Response regulator n=1 Tax=Cohnella suwonensis TaxID=696072 RepID=A0ABW0M497_9BACL
MIRVMIVEDEAPIQRSLRSLVESAHDMFEVAAMAFNGQEALEMLERAKPDLILTDIRMPVMNGLELTQYVRERYPDIEIILLSGYQDFEYARRAMQLGIQHYLLKPVSRSQIGKLLETIYSEISIRQKKSYVQYASSLISGEDLNDFPPERLESFGSHLLLLICAGPLPLYSFNDRIPGRQFWESRDLAQIVQTEVGKIGDLAVINGITVSERWLLFSYYKNQAVSRSPGSWAELIADRLGKELPVSIVYSRFYSDMSQTANLAQLIRSVMLKHIPFGAPLLLSIYDAQLTYDNETELGSHKERKFALALEQQNMELFKSEIVHLIDQWSRMLPSQRFVEDQLTRLLSGFVKKLGTDFPYSPETLELDVHKIIMHAPDYDHIALHICRIIDFLFSIRHNDTTEKEGNEGLADKIEDYLREHSAEDIDHKLLSDRFGLVPSYLSKVFAKYKGVSPAKFVVQLRVDKAKELLLKHPDLLTKDIAQLVGYTDASHFSRIFKRETGLYPTEFRKSNRIQES